jgi:phage major head subunit gpT-like protein
MTNRIINGEVLAAATTGFQTRFNEAFDQAVSQFDQVSMTVPSSTASETYAWLGKSSRFREWLGERVIQALSAYGYVILNKRFESTIGVNADDIRDDKIGVYAPLFSQLGFDAKTHPDELVFPLLPAGFAAKCYDGQFFFDTDHPVLDANGVAQSVSNFGGGSGTPWYLLDTRRPIRGLIFQQREEYSFQALQDPKDPNVFWKNQFVFGATGRGNAGYGLWQMAYGSKVALDSAGYTAARAAMMSFKADNGKPLGIVPNLLVVPPSLENAALEVVKVQRLANGGDNPMYGTAVVLVSPWLA